MREADVGSPSADTGRAISDHRISCPGLIWRRGSQSLMGNFGGSNRSSRWHWHQPRKGRFIDRGAPSINDLADTRKFLALFWLHKRVARLDVERELFFKGAAPS